MGRCTLLGRHIRIYGRMRGPLDQGQLLGARSTQGLGRRGKGRYMAEQVGPRMDSTGQVGHSLPKAVW
jgi:hypothetical protein